MKTTTSPDAPWGVLVAFSEKAKSRPQACCLNRSCSLWFLLHPLSFNYTVIVFGFHV
jgi:hypothetical protein